ncbi:UDP-N-acetylglucosamine 1-carboxyvinyltransferase [Candidatus Soleaferrea massiliensis]|uniref:UDP-N-acetylglucosamine 1-carboxyvinyltransferase n=1 Tax=Candidatus Soleaferrea massiliensis TaxID=1470354 RepID=UPI00058F4951|nr:UDP-N-acetylglucosamine 1-carboxyvinyltransferase [Candidatus Soleaferrea massiliensis]
MSVYFIEGGNPLYGDVEIHGAKNSALPILTATLIGTGKSVIHNCPDLTDIDAAIKILEYLGCSVEREGSTITVESDCISNYNVPDHLMREMRSSIVFLGAVIARCRKTRISFPGGCELGPRPIDLHLSALKKMGLVIEEDHGYLDCHVDGRLHGETIALSFPSVGATENIMLAASTAEGTTVITNAAREPEIVDLANYLNGCGAKITGAGESTIQIEGVGSLHGCEHRVIPDRIVAATFMSAVAVTGGSISLKQIDPVHLGALIPVFEEAGCRVSLHGSTLDIESTGRPKPIKMVRTMPYPGFPTDAQAPIMSMCAFADGTSVFVENIFENRFKHVDELVRLGASIKVEGRVAVVEGVRQLHSASVQATDLRGGAALVVAALGAKGTTEIDGLHHVDRGYERLEDSLNAIGAKVIRA